MTILTKSTLYPVVQSLIDEFLNPQMFNRSSGTGMSVPAVNISNTKTGFRLELAAPGFDKEDFKIETQDDLLIISAEKESAKEEDEDQYTRREFSMSSFKRTFNLPGDILYEEVKASYKDGLLVLELKSSGKKLQQKRQIAIQ